MTLTHSPLPPVSSEENEHFDLDRIAEDILENRCVLLLGPELLRCGGMAVSEAMAAWLSGEHRRHVPHVFSREGLFKFKDGKAKMRIQTTEIPKFFKETKADEGILKKLLAIPFHLVLQVTPDTFLSDTALRYSVKHQFRCFHGGGESIQAVEKPTATAPLFYNLCGQKDLYETMVLDFDDLYNYLKAVFSAPGLPEVLRTALKSANTFLFLGFQLDKWYFQLLMRWISDVESTGRFANRFNFGEHGGDIEEFVREHLQVVTSSREHIRLLDDLHDFFEKRQKLRPLTDPVSSNTVDVRRALQHGDLEKALEIFGRCANSVGEQNMALSLQSDFHTWKRGKLEYQLTNEQFFVHCQSLTVRLQKALDQFAHQL